jgi:hypothetical protein
MIDISHHTKDLTVGHMAGYLALIQCKTEFTQDMNWLAQLKEYTGK